MTSLFDQLGGETAIRTLVDRFYDLMDEKPDAVTIRAMHPDDLTESRRKLTLFLTMWTGGPRAYMEERGHPRMRARHLPFPIDDAARDAWLACMAQALDDTVPNPTTRQDLMGAFRRMADHMRNQ